MQDNADYKACPASADIPAAGFTDTEDASVNCLAYYGIVKGTTATTYSPSDSVSRWAMALYLTRAATEAGVTLGTGADQGFTDISGLSAEIQTAINQIKQLGVTTGKTATTYAPNDNVSRMEMALFIERWASSVSAGPGGTSDAERMTGAATTYINSDCGVATGAACTAVYNYTDIDSGSVTVEASNAIKELYTMGIHDGATATTFNPNADMTRAAMATFMEAALNHTNLRPEGLHIQSSLYSAIGANTHALHVSYRDANFDPITSTPVDVFRWTPTGVEGDRAFTTTTGACEDAVATGASITACKIDVAEPTTDLSGNLVPTANTTAVLSQALNAAGTDNYYAWTAASGTTYDNDLHSSGTTYDTIAVVANPDDADTRCSIDTPANAATGTAHIVESKWGAVTTITCQVTGGTASETAAAVPNPGVVVSMNRTRVNTNVAGVAGTATVDAENVVGLTDATGAVTFTVTGPANPLKAATDVVTDTVVISTANITIGSLPTTGNSGFMTEAGGNTLTFGLAYKSEASSAHSTVVTQTAQSALASAGVLGTTRTATATVYDQYGDGEPAIATTFTSVNTLHQGAICSLADPSVCTLAGHGLSIGDDIQVLLKGALVGACSGDATADGGAADAGAFTITTVPTADTFTMSCSDDAVAGTTASTAASPTTFTTTSFASAARTTNAAGQATFSWVDTETTTGIDTVTATPAAGTAGSVKFYRLAPAADYAEVGNGDTSRADSEANAGCVAIDTTAQTYIVVAHNDTDTSQSLTKYMKFSYDDNDQYATAGTAANPVGTTATQAAWQTAMVTTCTTGGLAANPGGVVSSIAHVVYGSGLSTDIQRHVMG